MSTALDKYSIDITQLSVGKSQISFLVDNFFLGQYKLLEKHKGKGVVIVHIDKQGRNIMVNLQTKVLLQTMCDRCLDNMNYELQTESNIIFSDDLSPNQENNPSKEFLHPNESKINIANKIYEDIFLAMPIRFIHDKKTSNKCNQAMISLLNAYSSTPAKIDPRWENLRKVKIKT